MKNLFASLVLVAAVVVTGCGSHGTPTSPSAVSLDPVVSVPPTTTPAPAPTPTPPPVKVTTFRGFMVNAFDPKNPYTGVSAEVAPPSGDFLVKTERVEEAEAHLLLVVFAEPASPQNNRDPKKIAEIDFFIKDHAGTATVPHFDAGLCTGADRTTGKRACHFTLANRSSFDVHGSIDPGAVVYDTVVPTPVDNLNGATSKGATN